MFERIVRWSISQRGLVLVASLLVMVAGGYFAKRLPIDAVPDLTNVQVTVLTSSPGLSPIEIEQYLTYPIEMALNGLPNLKEIRSISRTGISSVTIIFQDHVNIWFARQIVSERLKQAEADIPEGYGKPELAPVATGLGDIYEFVLRSDRHSLMELRTTLDWTITPKLRQVPGVIEVNSLGGEAKQFQVVVDPHQLAARHITLSQVIEALRRNNGAVGGGYIEKNSESIVIRGDGLATNATDLGRIVLKADLDGTPILLNHVSKSQIGSALRFGSANQVGQGPVVTGTVMMLIGSNSREVVKAVKKRVALIQNELPKGMRIVPFTDRETFINRVLGTVSRNLIEGALLVFVVLVVALRNMTGALLAAMAIPFSMLIAVMGMHVFDVPGNVMSLGAIDFGLLVDGAIVMLEAVIAHLASKDIAKKDIPDEIAHVTARVAKPIAFSVAIISLVYLPLMSLEGIEGKMFRPMAITVSLALLGSIIFTLTTFPAALAIMSKPRKGTHHTGGILTWLIKYYHRALRRVLMHPKLTLSAACVALLASGVVASNLGANFVPRIFEGQLVIVSRRLPSISLTESTRLGDSVARIAMRFPEVETAITRTGRAEVAVEPLGPESADTLLQLKETEHWRTTKDPEVLAEKIKKAVLDSVPATFPSISQPIEDRVNEMIAGSRADVVIKIFGDDLATLSSLGTQIGNVIQDIPGTGDLRVQRSLGLPMLVIKMDRVRLARYGIAIQDVLDVVEASRVGKVVGKVFEGSKRFDVVVKLPPTTDSEEEFASLLVGNAEGLLVPLAQVADLNLVEGPAVINREGLTRRLLVEVNVRGRDLVSYVNEAKARVEKKVRLNKGYSLSWGGQFENFERASSRLLLVVPIALGIIFGMLFMTFVNIRLALAVFASVPFALIGGILALKLRGLPFSIPAGVGFIALCGVAVLNGVVMVSDLIHKMESHSFIDSIEASAAHVLRPILTTAAVAALGFLPMAISTAAGAEVQRPLATVVIGGILSSTLLTLLVLPVILALFLGRDGDRRTSGPESASAS